MDKDKENQEVLYEFGKFVLDPRERILFADGEPVRLTDKLFDTLLVFVQNNGKLLTKEEMMTSIWPQSFVEEGNLAKTVSRLRKILNMGGVQIIETLPRHGYRFRVEITLRERNSLFVTPPGRLVPIPARSKKLPIIAALSILLLAGCSFLAYKSSFFSSHGRLDGTKNLTDNVAEDNWPVWSPDGMTILFVSNRDGPGDVYKMNADGTDVNRLTNTPATEIAAVWSSDGSKIVFDSERDGNREIYTMNADGSNQTRLTFDPTSDAGPVSFAPDGTRIAYARNASNEGSGRYNYDIWTMSVDGGDQRQLTDNPKFEAEPNWSPDGKTILFLSDRENNFDIYSINADGTGEMNLTRTPTNEWVVGWTPDGKQLICIGDTVAKPEIYQIFLMNPDGSARRQISSFTDLVLRVSYSPAAKKFAFVTKKDGNFEIYAMDAATLPNR